MGADYTEFLTGKFALDVFPVGSEKANIHNQAQPIANTNILATDLVPTNTPVVFRVQVIMSNAGNFSVVITKSGNSQVGILSALVAGTLHIFDILVHSGDTINFQYSVTGGTIQVVRVQEIGPGI